MTRRVPKRLAPVIVGVVAAALGVFTVGTSFAGPTPPGGVSGVDGPQPPRSTATAPESPAAGPAGAPSARPADAPAGSPAGVPSAKPKHPKPKPGKSEDPSSCSSCMVPPD